MKNFICILLLAVLAFSCAKQGSLTGGPKDTVPPVMDTLRSSPNYVTRFNGKEIKLTFNEWVVLKEASKEMVISPPIDPVPKVSLKKKTVIVDLGDNPKLRENTTYTINFGAAVRDLHESNAAEDLRFIFSTGAAIDSLKVEGIILDALTNEPVENITVMLYDNLTDSAVVKEKKPYYFSKTDKTGQFSIKNVRSGQFKAIAVDEGPIGNLRWDRPDNERVGFPDSLIMLSDTLQRAALVVAVFKNQGPLKKISANPDRYGVVKIVWSDRPENISFRTALDSLPGFSTRIEYDKDTMMVWYNIPQDTTTAAWWLITGVADTIRIKALSRSNFIARQRVRPLDDSGATPAAGARGGSGGKPGTPAPPKVFPLKTVPHIPGKPYLFRFNSPIVSIDTVKWIVTQDSLLFRNFSVVPDSVSVRALRLTAAWKPGGSLQLTLLPGAVTDLYGVSNVDTFQYQFNLLTEKQLGTLNLTVENTQPGGHYLLEILNGQTKEAEKRFTAASTTTLFQFKEMMPGSFIAKIVIDKNDNGRWDTGSYFEKRQPEVIFVKKLDALRANWELEATISAEKDDGKRQKLN